MLRCAQAWDDWSWPDAESVFQTAAFAGYPNISFMVRKRGKVGGVRVLAYSLAGSAVFFLLSNLAVWLTAMSVPGHAACMAGLAPCYAAAIPFFKWTVASALFYSALLFGARHLLLQRWPAMAGAH